MIRIRASNNDVLPRGDVLPTVRAIPPRGLSDVASPAASGFARHHPGQVAHMRGIVAAVIASGGLAVSGCGSGSSAAKPPAPVPTTASAAGTPAAIASAGSTPSASASASESPTAATSAAGSATASGSRCHTSELSATAKSAGAAAGNEGQVIILTNTGSATCTLDGYPGVGLFDSGGESSVTVGRGGGMLAKDPGPTSVSLAAGGTASATLTYTTGESGSGCVPKVISLDVTPPDETAALTAKLPMAIPTACGAHITALISGSNGPQPG